MNDTINTFTSTGAKFFAHQEAMQNLRNGKGQPIVTHVMPTDLCNHTCAFCSVQTREGSVLSMHAILQYLDTLVTFGLKAVIISGGGNPILYRDRETKATFNDLVAEIYTRGLEIGLISNGMPLQYFPESGRWSWRGVHPETLDRCSWIRVSLAGLDHRENTASIPDIDRSKTTLGFSYILHDIYEEPGDKNHGKVSALRDLVTHDNVESRVRTADSRIPVLTYQIGELVKIHRPAYVRLLPNCLEPHLIERRCEQLHHMAQDIDPDVVFVQYKPPAAPKACYLGYIHPVLNSDGYVYPCDSCVLNESADHRFASPWRICHGSEVATLYREPVRSLIRDPGQQCPGCVFTRSNVILESVVDGTADLTPPATTPTHVNFV